VGVRILALNMSVHILRGHLFSKNRPVNKKTIGLNPVNSDLTSKQAIFCSGVLMARVWPT